MSESIILIVKALLLSILAFYASKKILILKVTSPRVVMSILWGISGYIILDDLYKNSVPVIIILVCMLLLCWLVTKSGETVIYSAFIAIVIKSPDIIYEFFILFELVMKVSHPELFSP